MEGNRFPRPVVGALIFNPEGKVFLMKSHKWKNNYTIPGGHVEWGETLEQALKREVKEETGLDIEILDFVCTKEHVFGEEFWKKKHFICLDFAAKTSSGNVRLSEEAQEYDWFTIEQALKLPLVQPTRQLIEEYLKKHPR